MRSSTALSLLAMLIVPLTGIGCAGGGGGAGEPCCEATGSATGPSSFAPGELMAQPIAFLGTASCANLTFPLTLPEYEVLGDARAVDPSTNRYTVSIDDSAIGREVAIRIFDTDLDGNERTQAIVGLAEPAVQSDTPIPAAPVFLVPGALDESTLEEVAICLLRNGTLQGESLQNNMRRNDVRAAITVDVHTAYVNAGIDEVVLAIRNYRHALNGFGNAMPADADRVAHAVARGAIERAADAYRDANVAGDPVLIGRRAALERFRRITTIPAPFGDSEPLHRHLQTWAQDWNEEIDLGLATLDTSSESVRAQYLENHLLRFAIAEARIVTAADAASVDLPLSRTFEDVGNNVVSIDALLANLEEGLINPGVGFAPAPANVAGFYAAAWTTFGDGLAKNIGAQKPIIAGQLTATKSNADGNGIAVQNTLNRTQSHTEILGLLYEGGGTPGVWRDLKDQIAVDYVTALPDAPDQSRLTDLLYYSVVNVPPY